MPRFGAYLRHSAQATVPAESVVNEQCRRTVLHAQRCKGTNQSVLGDDDWAECPYRAASGYDRAALCFRCRGSGWVFVRSR
jgi:hypothetical protein